MKLKKEVLKKIQNSRGIMGRLCAETGKTFPTILRWVENNDEGLTLASSLKVIREELNLTDDQILDRQKEAA